MSRIYPKNSFENFKLLQKFQRHIYGCVSAGKTDQTSTAFKRASLYAILSSHSAILEIYH